MTAYNTKQWEVCGTVTDFQDRNDLVLITDSQCVADTLQSIGEFEAMNDDVGLFVKAKEGEYKEVYLFYGIPYLYKTVWRLRPLCL